MPKTYFPGKKGIMPIKMLSTAEFPTYVTIMGFGYIA